MATLGDVARLAGVSKSTASRALNRTGHVSEETSIAVHAAAQSLGFRAAQSAVRLATGRTRTIGTFCLRCDNWYNSTVVHGMSEAATQHEYDLLVCELDAAGSDGPAKLEFFLQRGRVDAAVFCACDTVENEVLRLTELGVPLVVLGEPADEARSFSLDDELAAKLATEHLLSLGHRDILHANSVNPNPSRATSATGRRIAGYSRAMREAGLQPRTITVPAHTEEARLAAHDILARVDAPTAVFATTDEIAFGFLLAAPALGIRIPDDLSVISVDDHEFSKSFGLTTVRQDPVRHAKDAFDWILDQLASPSEDQSHTNYEPEFLLRASTGPAPRR
ncbi:LacI family DNA-binding transcriptional regulator [Humidisolicoccus flavus]|uniref:LacI family DNA-binding transcriptional regulator n=1 Tax=Humidisolicoccus flavus TaxID=3111414 RepID=UPI00324EAD25